MATTTKTQKPNIVQGRVVDLRNRPLSNLIVKVYDQDLRSFELLAEAETDRDGKYKIAWRHSQLDGRGRKSADIVIKVFSKEKQVELYQSPIDEVRFNASAREEINVVIRKEIKREKVEFDSLVEEVTFLANEIEIADLSEDNEHRDVTFLSRDLEVPAEKIEHLIVAHRLAKISKIEAGFFYALLRMDTLLHNDLSSNLRARLSIGISAEARLLLYDAALTDAKKITEDVQKAGAEWIVSETIVENLGQSLELLPQYKKEGEAYYQNEHPQKIIGLLSSVFKEGRLEEVQRLFKERKHDLNGFFEKVTGNEFFKSSTKEKDEKSNLLLGQLLGFGNDLMPGLIKERKIKEPADVRKLAKLNKKDWVEELSKKNAETAHKESINTYASAIVRKFEKEFPTTAFTAQLEREQKKVIDKQDQLLKFLNQHEEFEFLKDNVDLFMKKKKVGAKEREAIGDELKSIQRIFKLTPNYSKTLALREEKVHSALSIVNMGKKRFTRDIAPKAGISAQEAKEVYLKAETRHTAAMLMVGDLHDSMSVVDIASFETEKLAPKLEELSTDFPNLKSLFKGVDTCECKHCRSVYSPAAYMVEILQFLGKRAVVAGNAQSVLLNRRPDLGEIDLSCANANTPLKYIDLVCELLEEAIAPDTGVDFSGNLSDGSDPLPGKVSNALLTALQDAEIPIPVSADAMVYETESPHYLRGTGVVCKIENVGGNNYKVYRLRQTFGTTEELDAAPEYVNQEAYKKLKAKPLAFKLPFDLHHTEAKAYFNRFGVDRADLMKAFQDAVLPTEEAIAAESLGLTDVERLIITEPPSPNNNDAQQAYWNVPAPGNVVEHLKRVDHFLDRTALTYKELELLLKLSFIDKGENLLISHDDLTCDTAKKEIANLDVEPLDRMHRFLRLQKKTGWKFEVLDALITQKRLGGGKLNDACLIKIAQVKEIADRTGLKLEELVGCFGEIPHADLGENAPQPLYHNIFLNKAKNGVIDEDLLPEKIDGSQSLETPELLKIIATSLQLKQADLEKFLLPLLPDTSPDTDTDPVTYYLTFANLSYLWLASRLIKKLKVKAEEFAILIGLTGIYIADSPENTLRFIDAIDDFKDSPLKAADVQFIIQHEAVNLGDRIISAGKIEEFLAKLSEEYQTINTDLKSKYDENLTAEEQAETLINVLSGLPGVDEEAVQAIRKFLEKDWISAADAKTFIDAHLDAAIDRTPIDAAIDGLDTAEEQAKTIAKTLVNILSGLAGAEEEEQAKTIAKTLINVLSGLAGVEEEGQAETIAKTLAETLINVLSGLVGGEEEVVVEEVVQTTLEFFKKDWISAADAKSVIYDTIDAKIDRASIYAAIDDLSTAEEQAKTLAETLINALSDLTGAEEEAIERIRQFLEKDWVSAAETKTFIDAAIDAQIGAPIYAAIDDLGTAEEQAKTLAETLINVLSDLAGVEGEAIERIRQFLEKDWVSAAEAKTFINAAIDAQIGAPIYAAINADISTKQKALVKFLLDAIAEHQILTAKRATLKKLLSVTFKSDLAIIHVVLTHAVLKQLAPDTKSILAALLDDFVNDTTVANYPNAYDSLRLVHKVLYLINALDLTPNQVEWYFINNPKLGWFELDGIPFKSGQESIDFSSFLSFLTIISLSKEFKAIVNPADAENPITFFSTAEVLLPTSTASKENFMQSLALLTSYDKEVLHAIDTHLFPEFDKAKYRQVATWKSVLECAVYTRKLSASVAQIRDYIKPTLGPSDVSDLRSTLKSRYDESTWLTTLKEIMDSIRPQKRDVLVAYLLATKFKDENDLYEHFLVDVEMEACMPSSRIVLAHNSIQLFVQRCLMGLEPDAIADVDNDPNWDQWKWVKNYRVWEANRKVFLYPENWYDVSLSDNKSYLLSDFIDELQQNELTNDTAEQALKNYLEKLDNIAFLEVMATWYDTTTKHMHVFARTKGGDPAQYYYRRFENERYWTPWEKVDLDITSDILLAFMRNDRLHLAWLVTSEEADPDPESTIPDDTAGTTVKNDKPKKKLKIQLAISEFSNNKWQPKKVSTDSILTPSVYTDIESYFDIKKYNMIYAQPTDQVWIFSSYWYKDEFSSKGYNDNQHHALNGIFAIAGCKGYPELVFEGNSRFPDFYPDFKDAKLLSQRYNEITSLLPVELAVRNGMSLFYFYELLNKTPGQFRITYPHQFTNIDLLALIYQFFILLLFRGQYTLEMTTAIKAVNRFRYKIPLGTLLPYFDEDSNHAYVIIPGFYKKNRIRKSVPTISHVAKVYSFNDVEKRTASDVFQLLEDMVNWVKKMESEFKANPTADIQAAIEGIIKDSDFQDILSELSKYEALDFVFNLLIGKTGSDEFDALLTELRDARGLVYGEQFKNMYHPLVCPLRKVLYKDGIPELMKRDTQLQESPFSFKDHYKPNESVVPKADEPDLRSFPVEDVDFSSDGSYSVYNWDLFYRLPLHVAGSLTKNQRFEEALTWFHYMFNPTGALPGNGVQKYWVTKPFYMNQEVDYLAQRIDNLMYAVSDSDNPNINELKFAIDEWRAKPFRPDAIARFRPVAYQKALLMKYLDNLIEWGDHLFRQDTMESVAQATQMYVLADKLLGPKPRVVPAAVKPPYETYNQIEAKLDSFGNALVELENILPDLLTISEGNDETPPPPVTLLYFCIPRNEKMDAYWDRVADRLFKIRHCQNIDGVERTLALFAPPIDPGMLVKAFAAGLDISSVLAGLNAPTPYYRFNLLSQKATELAQEVRLLGNALLGALEKKDAEALTLLRNDLETNVLKAVKELKQLQIDEAKEQIEVLELSKKVTEERQQYYTNIEKIISKEQLSMDKFEEAKNWQLAANITYALGAALALVPDLQLGASGFGGSPHGTAKFGGSLLAHSTDAVGKTLNIFSAIANFEATKAATTGGHDRRYSDWKLQERLATKEIASIDKQITAAEIRRDIASTDLKSQEMQIENAEKMDDFMRSKFTNKELYDWMIGQISSVYFKSYQLAHDLAKKAERCYRFELGNDDTFISYGYWDSMKKGLQSADHLIHDIKAMETSYMDKNKREYEITKHVSLAQLDPLALVILKASGVCDFDIPEAIYDLDFAGQYLRRIKSVSISIPCIAGPYTSVSAKLSLIKNRYRKNVNPDNSAGTGYAEDLGNDERFVYNVGTIQSIATSHAQNDSGVFELNFRDERYLPFENTGAISSWRLELPEEVRQFDYDTIPDVIMHVKYTAREGGSGLKTAANEALKEQLDAIRQNLSQSGLHAAINLKHDLPNEWHLLKDKGAVDLTIDKHRFPYMAQPFDTAIDSVRFMAKVKDNPASFEVVIDDSGTTNLARIDDLNLCSGINSGIELGMPFNLSVAEGDVEKLEELVMVVKYSL